MLIPWRIPLNDSWTIPNPKGTRVKCDLVNMPFIPMDEPRHSAMWVYAQLAALQVPSMNSYRGCSDKTFLSFGPAMEKSHWKTSNQLHINFNQLAFLCFRGNEEFWWITVCPFMSSSFVTFSSFSAALRSIQRWLAHESCNATKRHAMPSRLAIKKLSLAVCIESMLLQVNDLDLFRELWYLRLVKTFQKDKQQVDTSRTATFPFAFGKTRRKTIRFLGLLSCPPKVGTAMAASWLFWTFTGHGRSKDMWKPRDFHRASNTLQQRDLAMPRLLDSIQAGISSGGWKSLKTLWFLSILKGHSFPWSLHGKKDEGTKLFQRGPGVECDMWKDPGLMIWVIWSLSWKMLKGVALSKSKMEQQNASCLDLKILGYFFKEKTIWRIYRL